MDSLRNIVRNVVFSYATAGLKLRMYRLADEERGIYAVNVVDWPEHQYPAGVVVLARVEGDKVFIEEDITDRPLAEALIQAGLRPDQVVWAYDQTAAQATSS